FESSSTAEALFRVLTEDPLPPRCLRPELPRDLQTICLTCLYKDPADRYPSALALAEDLSAFRAGQPIRARAARPWERVRAWGRRRPAEAVLVGTAVVALVGLAVGFWWSSALAVSAVALLGLVAGAAWYGARLRQAVRQAEEQWA